MKAKALLLAMLLGASTVIAACDGGGSSSSGDSSSSSSSSEFSPSQEEEIANDLYKERIDKWLDENKENIIRDMESSSFTSVESLYAYAE